MKKKVLQAKKRVIKTSFEEEQRMKDDAFLKMKPLQRLALMYKIRERMRRRGVKYSYDGMKVTVKRIR